MTEDEKRLWDVVISLIRQYPRIIFGTLFILLILIPGIISFAYWFGISNPKIWTGYDAKDILFFWGTFLSFLGTISLGAIAIWQNLRLNEENNKLKKKIFKEEHKVILSSVEEKFPIHFSDPFYPKIKILTQNEVNENIKAADVPSFICDHYEKYYYGWIIVPYMYYKEKPKEYSISLLSIELKQIDGNKENIAKFIFINNEGRITDYITSQSNKIITTPIAFYINSNNPSLNQININKPIDEFVIYIELKFINNYEEIKEKIITPCKYIFTIRHNKNNYEFSIPLFSQL